MALFKNILKCCDVVGAKMEFTYEGSSRIKTWLGGIASIILIVLMIVCIYMFGIEIVHRDKPLILSGSVYNNDTKISIRENPIVFHPVDNLGFVLDFDSYFDSEVIIMTNKIVDGELIQVNAHGMLELCDLDKHFSKQKAAIQDGSVSIVYKGSYCVSPNYMIYDNGTVVEDELYLYNSIAYIPNHHFHVRLRKCNPKINSKCDEAKSVALHSFYLDIYYFSYTKNLVDPVNPYFLVVMGDTYSLSDTTSLGVVIYRVHSILETDSGWIFEDISSLDVVVFEKIQSSISFTTEYLLDYVMSGDTMIDSNKRSYKKFQSLLADLGGVLKVLLLAMELLIRTYSKSVFFSRVINDNFCLQSSKQDRPDTSNIIRRPYFASQQVFTNNQQSSIVNTTKDILVPCNVGFSDYVKSVLFSRNKQKNNYKNTFLNFFNYEVYIRKIIEVDLLKQFAIKTSKEDLQFESLIDITNFNIAYNVKPMNNRNESSNIIIKINN